ncbi:hypothetical protein G6F35_015581 [Rhizopus arrhizus]|nr:hypothetical protein G6F35_015581 [Rhizopus arrhizus]
MPAAASHCHCLCRTLRLAAAYRLAIRPRAVVRQCAWTGERTRRGLPGVAGCTAPVAAAAAAGRRGGQGQGARRHPGPAGLATFAAAPGLGGQCPLPAAAAGDRSAPGCAAGAGNGGAARAHRGQPGPRAVGRAAGRTGTRRTAASPGTAR